MSNSYGHVFLGESPIKYQPASKGQNISLCALISLNGVEYYQLREGGFNGENFADFLIRALERGRLNNRPLIILDNASIHSRALQTLNLNEMGIEIMFLPTYSPELNPIENFFGYIKSKIKARRPIPKTKQELKNVIVEELELNIDKELGNYYEKMWRLVYSIINNLK